MYKEGTLLIVCSKIINLGTALTAQVRHHCLYLINQVNMAVSHIHLNLDDFPKLV